jgi:hypothetical protein
VLYGRLSDRAGEYRGVDGSEEARVNSINNLAGPHFSPE